MSNFIEQRELFNLMKHNTCFKVQQGTTIDLILTNKKIMFPHTNVFETELSDFHVLIYTMLKLQYQKLPPKQIKYRCYKSFNQDMFNRDLNEYLKTMYCR